MVMESVDVYYQEQFVGAVLYNGDTKLGSFQYDPSFIDSGIELSPIKMPLSKKIYSFPNIDEATFKGLPGLLADSLPDDFGNSILNAWMVRNGRSIDSITPTQRLQYTGKRGMGALEYRPATQLKSLNASQPIYIEELVNIAQQVLDSRNQFTVKLSPQHSEDQEAMLALMSVGMSAGGARPKAVLAFNHDFTQVKSGQTNIPEGFTHYLMKFDGVSEANQDKETFGDPLGFTTSEYIYYLMAKECEIDIMPCRLIEEGSRRHFITQRYDRIGNQKVHVQTLNGLVHQSYKQIASYSYEELFGVARQLKLSPQEALQIFRRMVFNVVARNHDDHSKNFSFMLVDGKWQLAPAYDIAFSYKPGSYWVDKHWMNLNGKRDNFQRSDFYAFQNISPIFKKRKIDYIIDQTIDVVAQWPRLAIEHELPTGFASFVQKSHRISQLSKTKSDK